MENRFGLGILSALSIVLTMVECALPLIMKIFIPAVSGSNFLNTMLVAIAALAVFAGARFTEIYCEKWLVINWSNRLRRTWYGWAMTNSDQAKSLELSRLMTKLTYHFGLLQMGLKHAFFSVPKMVAGAVALLAVSALLNRPLFLLVSASVLLSIGLIWLGNVLAKNYVSQDQTLYSRMLFDMHKTVASRRTHQQQGNIENLLDSFDNLVDMDSHFRLRRELWVRFSPEAVFIFISLIALIFVTLENSGIQFARIFNTNAAVLGVISALIVRHLYICLQFGLFLFPLYLGSFLSVPDRHIDLDVRQWEAPRNLVLVSDSARLGKQTRRSKYEWEFESGDRIRFVTRGSEQEVIELLTARLHNRAGKSWLVIHNGRRLSYNSWKNVVTGVHYIDPLYSDHLSLSSMLTGKLPEDIGGEDVLGALSKMRDLMHNGSSIFELMDLDESKLQTELDPQKTDWETMMALQIVAAIATEPAIIIVDPVVSRFPSQKLQALIRQLNKNCPDSIVIGFDELPFNANKTFSTG